MAQDSSSVDLRLMQAAALLDRDPLAAARMAADLLAMAPNRADIAMLLGTARRASGNPASALEVFANLAAAHPNSAVIQLEHAQALAAAGRTAHAVAGLERAVLLQPNLAEGWRELSLMYSQAGNPDGCDRAYARYHALVKPGHRVNEASILLGNGRPEAAKTVLTAALRTNPQDVLALRLAAQIAAAAEDYLEAQRLLKEALHLAPGFSEARLDLVRIYRGQQNPEAMLALLERLLRLDPRNLQYLLLKSAAFNLLSLNVDSLQILRQLIQEHPQNELVWVQYGHALRAGGELQQAIDAYRTSIQLAPRSPEAWFSLANLKTVQLSEADIATIQAQLESQELLPESRVLLEFSLGKAFEDERRFQESFTHYAQGNAVRRALIRYDSKHVTGFVERNERLYRREFFAARQGWGVPSTDPIFILGLPRSGSTLLEQILASHSRVEGTRELTNMLSIAAEFGAAQSPELPPVYPKAVAKMKKEKAVALGERYLAEAGSHRRLGRPHFIDKMPSNWMHIGLIQLLLPKARIIDARRGPLASGLANFKQHFQQGQWFSYDLADVGYFYRDYVRLMGHFDEVLPGRIYRVQYEHLVSDLETQVRRLLDYCGLPFEPQCLRFHETKRVVQTVSSEQVRRPLYKEALDQWRNYEPWLDPLKQALGPLAEAESTPATSSADPQM